jgi:hypothetical protein
LNIDESIFCDSWAIAELLQIVIRQSAFVNRRAHDGGHSAVDE